MFIYKDLKISVYDMSGVRDIYMVLKYIFVTYPAFSLFQTI